MNAIEHTVTANWNDVPAVESEDTMSSQAPTQVPLLPDRDCGSCLMQRLKWFHRIVNLNTILVSDLMIFLFVLPHLLTVQLLE